MADPERYPAPPSSSSPAVPTCPPRLRASLNTSDRFAPSTRSPRLAASWGGPGDTTAPSHTSNRVSISHAQRVQVPPAVEAKRTGLPSSPTVGAYSASRSQHSSPRLSQSVGASPRVQQERSTFGGGGGASPRVAQVGGGGVFPPRLSSRQPSYERQSAAGEGASGAQHEGSNKSPKMGGGLTRRKPPPPLDFGYEGEAATSRASMGGSRASSAAASPVNVSPSKDEERDTLSGLINFDPTSSPVLSTDIPSSRLSFLGDSSGSVEEDDLPYTSNSSSYLAAHSLSTFDYTAPRSHQLSSSYGNSGLGLGLPFSTSASANLSSLGTSPPSSATYSVPMPPVPSSSSSATSPMDYYRSPAGRSQGSPAADRGQLIGLGELATPRWTSGPLERRWGATESEERQQPGTQRRLEDNFGVQDQCGVEHEPMPPIRTGNNVVESPTVSRPTPRYSNRADRPFTTYDSPNRPFGGSTSSHLYAPPLLPSSASSATISTDASPAALLNFGVDATGGPSFGPLDFSVPPPSATSPAYSTESIPFPSVSPRQRAFPMMERGHDVASEELNQTVRRADAPRRRDSSSRRKSGSAALSPVVGGLGQSWSNGQQGSDVIGLGFEHEIDPPLPVSSDGASVEEKASRRLSVGSTTGSARRLSSRSLSIDGKTAKQHRRSSTGKGSFAHLPPSPAASTASHPFPTSPAPALPPTPSAFGPPPPNPTLPPVPTSSVSTPSARTPDHNRLSRHSFASHHSSPSIVAASILRHTRDLEGVDVDIERAAATDEGTAAALAKLDGLSSPRMSRIGSSSVGAGSAEARSRKSSRGPGDAPPPNVRRDSSQSSKRRTRSSTGESGASVAREAAHAGEGTGTSKPTSRNVSPTPPPPALPSPALYHANSSPAAPTPKSPHSPSVSSMPTTAATRNPSQNRLASSSTSISTSADPFPTSTSPFKRGSSSSASMTAGTWTSHDSTSATSVATRSAASKYRRSSAGSDISSTPSAGEVRPGLDRGDSAGEVERSADIPPVPPLPKDWETYRPTTSTTSASSAQQSPRFEFARRPSQASSIAESTSPRAPPMQFSRTTSSSGKSGAGESNLPVATASGSSRRKWSISSAFHKATKSPKASVKESASYQDLQSAAGRRDRTSSFGQHLGEVALPRRLAASTNDITSIASGKSSHDASGTGSLGRSSMRSGKAPSFPRTRTSSQSSVSTTRTNQTASQNSAMPPPSVVATSPGRSRSSLINPRRTPSGIPFFSRKSSTSDVSLKTPSPNTEKGEFSPIEEKTSSGRKSILGLNFLRSGGSKRDKEKDKGPLSPPPSSVRSTFSSSTTSSASKQVDSFGVASDEFGRRQSLATPKSSSLLTRKRGKTIGAPDKGEDVFGSSQPVQLPPMQMNALPHSTARRVESMSSSIPSKPPVTANNVLSTPRTRTSKLQDSIKANLPTIAGSPSTHGGAAAVDDQPRIFRRGSSPLSTTPPPKSQTPTKIPRLKGTSSTTVSPRTSPSTTSSSTFRPAPQRLGSFSTGTLDPTPPLSASLASTSSRPPATNDDTNEFGVVSREPGLALGEKTLTTRRRVDSEVAAPSQIPRSRSTASGSTSLASSTRSIKEPVETPVPAKTAVPRAGRRPSTVDEEKKTPSASLARVQARTSALSASTSRLPSQQSSDLSTSASVGNGLSSATRKSLPKSTEQAGIRRASVPATTVANDTLSSTKSTRSFTSKMSIPSRVPKPASTSSRLSPSETGSRSSSAASGMYGVDEDKAKGDEEMAAYVKRMVSKNLAKGVSEEQVRKMFEFPDPTEPLPPLNPEDALSLYSRYLAPYERDEIMEYRQVYFVGPNCDKKPATKENPTNNFGYDDERGDYLLVPHDHIQFRYEVIDVLGKGSFGQVLQCRDHKTGDMVAVKIIRNKKRFHHQALVEIKVLENLVKWDPDEKHYVIRMVESFTFRGHLCIVTELLSINLYELVKANSFAGFSTTLIRRFASQILKSLILLYHHRVVHCDLKPENILLRHPAKSGIKVIDFGSSCFENEKVYTYIQSRFYRSPEVILGMNYHMGIDMWSLGCILAEMYTGYPIFPGENEQEQLACIMEVQGLPDRYLIDRSSRKRLFFDSTGAPRPVVNSKGRRRRPASKTLEQVLRCQDELFVDFIAKCLAWDPDRRLKPEKALRHPWFARNFSSASIPSRTVRSSSTLSSSASSRTATAAPPSHSSSPSISTPLKKLPQASTSTAPVPRTRTISYSGSTLSSTTASATRLGSKASLGLPPSSRYSVKS